MNAKPGEHKTVQAHLLEDAEELGRVLAEDLLSRGAREILQQLYNGQPG